MTEKGTKHDTGKSRVDLISPNFLLGVGDVLAFGAKKYDAWNWTKGIEYSRLIGAAMRHLLAFSSGEDVDKESGFSHLYHAACCLMMLSEMHPEMDDRFKGGK